MSNQNLLIEVKDNVEIITLNRPHVLNSLSGGLMAELDKAFAEALSNEKVRVIVITGAGRAFAAGKDIPEFIGKRGKGMSIICRGDHQILAKIWKANKPVIAAMNGIALGGGLELAMHCHIRVAADNIFMGQPENALGAIPGDGGTQLLPRFIGKGAALYYLLTGENIPAQEAYRLGLVDKLVPADKLMVTALAIAKVIAQKAPVAIRLVLEAVRKGSELTNYDEYMKVEEELQEVMGDTEDFNEAIKAFIEKRPVVFKGR
jgi:enoyl-CoA hydratase/carnithine racemase